MIETPEKICAEEWHYRGFIIRRRKVNFKPSAYRFAIYKDGIPIRRNESLLSCTVEIDCHEAGICAKCYEHPVISDRYRVCEACDEN